MKKPNIILVLIDDLGWKDLSGYGSEFYETPNLDRLAEQGIRFTDACASCPVCSPSRASLLTGKYPATVGITDWIDSKGFVHPCKGKLVDVPYLKYLPLSEKTIAAELKEVGYRCWHVGKWHLGDNRYYPENHGFDVNIGGCELGYPRNGYFAPYKIETISEGEDGEYLTDRLTDEAIQLIQQDANEPFFLNLWHYGVHTPIMAKPQDIERFEQKARALGLDQRHPFEEGEFFPTKHKGHLRVTRRMFQSDPIYAAMIYNLDWNMGRLMDALEACGKTENTLVVFTSDNGGLATADGSPTSNQPLLEGKGWMYEGGVRVPLIMRWPDTIQPRGCSSIPVTSPDLYPTFMEAAGLQPTSKSDLDGVSLMPIIRNDGSLDRNAIFWHYPHYGNQGGTPGSSIRMGEYKLIEFFEDNRIELYSLHADINEQQNLISVQPELAKQMQGLLASWRESVEAKIPLPNPEYTKGQGETQGNV